MDNIMMPPERVDSLASLDCKMAGNFLGDGQILAAAIRARK